MISVINLTMNVHKYEKIYITIIKILFTKVKKIINKFEINDKIFHYYAPDISNVHIINVNEKIWASCIFIHPYININ